MILLISVGQRKLHNLFCITKQFFASVQRINAMIEFSNHTQAGIVNRQPNVYQ